MAAYGEIPMAAVTHPATSWAGPASRGTEGGETA